MAPLEEEWRQLVARQRQALDAALADAGCVDKDGAWKLRLPAEAPLALAFAAGLGLGLLLPRLRAPFRRFATVDDLPLSYFHQERKIRAVVANVSDGDTFRARHLPLFRGAGSFDGKVSDHTLQIRLAGIGILFTRQAAYRLWIDDIIY